MWRFIMIMEYLSRMTDKLVENGTIDGFRVSDKANGTVISYLQFADDDMFFLVAIKENAKALKNLLIWSFV